MEKKHGNLFVITGPSGAGKDSVIETARELGLDFGMIITTTTRPMRPTEAEGKPYYFVSHGEFEQKIQNGDMIEYAQVYGNLYGSTKTEVERVQQSNKIVIIRVDPQGARTFKKMLPEVVTIFIKPPNFEFLQRHLVKRNADSKEVIEKRLQIAREELQNIDQWDGVLVNEEGQLQQTAQQLIELIHREASK